jgi:hypothetical protein
MFKIYGTTETVVTAVTLYRPAFQACSFQILVWLQAFLTQEFRDIFQFPSTKLHTVTLDYVRNKQV